MINSAPAEINLHRGIMNIYNPHNLPATGRCPAKSKNSLKICSQPLYGEEKLCIWHDPDRVADKQALCSQLGKKGRAAQMNKHAQKLEQEVVLLTAGIENAGHVRAILEQEINEVKQKVRDPVKRAMAIAALSRVTLQSMKMGNDDGELERVREEMKKLTNSKDNTIELVWPDAPKAAAPPKLMVVE